MDRVGSEAWGNGAGTDAGAGDVAVHDGIDNEIGIVWELNEKAPDEELEGGGGLEGPNPC
jgi:hypothetical protein